MMISSPYFVFAAACMAFGILTGCGDDAMLDPDGGSRLDAQDDIFRVPDARVRSDAASLDGGPELDANVPRSDGGADAAGPDAGPMTPASGLPDADHFYWVDNVNGDDDAPGSEEAPFASIDHALDVAEGIARIHLVNSGSGYGGVCVERDNTQLVGISSPAGDKPVIDEMTECDGRLVLVFSRGDDIWFQGLVLDARGVVGQRARALIFSGTASNPIYRNGARYVDALGPGFHPTGRSLISASLCYDCVLEHSSSIGAEEHGIYWTNHQDGSVIRNNYVSDADGACLQLNSDPETFERGHPIQDGIMSGGLVENNVFHNCGTDGGASINLAGVQDTVFRNNVISGERLTGGVAMWDDGYSDWGASGDFSFGCTGNTFVHNTFDCRGCTRHALSFRNGSNANMVQNNIILTSGEDALAVDSDSDQELRIDRNLYSAGVEFEDTNGRLISLEDWQSLGHDASSVSTNGGALFVGFNDLHLASGSPAIDFGLEVDVDQDIEGNARPQGEGYDVGAYESL